MSFLRRAWNAVRNPIRYVGRDLEGNRFYESPSPNDPSRPKRTVQYFDSQEVWRYIGGGKRLPIQWSAWLSHTRPYPPSIEELQADMTRQQRLAVNVALIEARDRAETEERLRVRQEDAQRALEIAAQRAQGQVRIPESSSSLASSESEHALGQPIQTQTTTQSSSGAGHSSMSNVPPPAFLTPTTPKKAKPSTPFAVPPIHESTESSTPSNKQQLSLPSMPSRPVSDTESWTPKARVRRG